MNKRGLYRGIGTEVCAGYSFSFPLLLIGERGFMQKAELARRLCVVFVLYIDNLYRFGVNSNGWVSGGEYSDYSLPPLFTMVFL